MLLDLKECWVLDRVDAYFFISNATSTLKMADESRSGIPAGAKLHRTVQVPTTWTTMFDIFVGQVQQNNGSVSGKWSAQLRPIYQAKQLTWLACN
jgi:hypothetical protein